MTAIICYGCFARFTHSRAHFKCLEHSPPFIFPASGPGTGGRRSWDAVCPHDDRFTGFRVCPHCRRDLPYYVGRTNQNIVAITGDRGAGKTAYLWSLLYQLSEIATRKPAPFAVAMFETDSSYRAYQKLCATVLIERTVPEATQVVDFIQGQFDPVIARLLCDGRKASSFCNVVFYDPPGELFANLEKIRYLRYLAHARAMIFLVEVPAHASAPTAGPLASAAGDHLAAIAHQIREVNGISKAQKLPQTLAIGITKSDEAIFREYDRDDLVANRRGDQTFWSRWRRGHANELDRTSHRCEQLLEGRQYHSLLATARQNFEMVRFFALSSLGQSPVRGRLIEPPQPVGVENPLFWILRTFA